MRYAGALFASLFVGPLALLLTMCGGGDSNGNVSADGDAADGANGSSSGSSSGTSGSSGSSGSSGGTDGGSGVVRPVLAFAKDYPIGFSQIAAVPGGGWAMLGRVSAQTTVANTVLNPGSLAVLRTDAQGTPTWARSINVSQAVNQGPPNIGADETGAIYVVGLTNSTTIDFGDGASASLSGQNPTTSTGYVGKYNATGTAQWVRLFYAPQGVGSISVAARNGVVAVAGGYYPYSSINYRTAGNVLVIAPGFFFDASQAAFVASLSAADGYATWFKRLGAEKSASFSSVAIDTTGAIVVSGGYSGGELKAEDQSTVGPSATAGFVVKYTNAGVIAWARSIAGASFPAIAGANDGARIVAAGTFTGSVDFGLGARTGPSGVALTLNGASGATTSDAIFGGMVTAFDVGLFASGGAVVAVRTPYGTTPKATFDGLTVPTGDAAYLLAIDGANKAKWLEQFPYTNPSAAVRPSSMAVSETNVVALVGSLGGPWDFGSGPVPATGGFLTTYAP